MIDYSQYSLWNFCPWAWYERYILQRQLRYVGQRSDPLCLGSLVHNGLDNFARAGVPEIDEVTTREMNPTPDTLKLAHTMLLGYMRRYPAELWPVERSEQPLLFPIDNDFEGRGGLQGLAKLDGYFYVPQDTTIESGIPGYTLTLSRGWWAKEYKTKAFGRRRADWIKEWQSKRQADFQMLALQHMIEEHPRHRIDDITVQGVLVRVLEKPHEYTPMRKCKACGESSELMSFVALAEGYACPLCGRAQAVTPYAPKVPKTPDYFSLLVTRQPERLAIAKQEILNVAIAMQRAYDDPSSMIPNRDACVNNIHHRECEYFGPHTYGNLGDTRGDNGYVTINATAYIGLAEVTE